MQNAFSHLLRPDAYPGSLDIHQILVPDALHEWDSGNIPRLVKHLVRILFAIGKDRVIEFNRRLVHGHGLDALYSTYCRFSLVPPFGTETIRPFGPNVSEMKQFAARDWEDILQVCTSRSAILLDH